MGRVKKKAEEDAIVAAFEPISIGAAAVEEGLSDITFSKLVLDETNARKGHKPDPQLLANIAAHGLLMPLIVKHYDNDTWAVVDGGRRYVTIKDGIERGVLPADEWKFVACRVVSSDKAALEISMSANLHVAMHPLDVCETILELAKTAEDEKEIAAHFGQTVQWVQQRAKLAQLTDKARQAYRDGRMDLGTAQLMTRLTEKDQDRVCKGKGAIYANDVTQILSAKSIDASHAMFDWKKDYPPEKVQYGLFDDVVLLLDLPLFKEKQAEAMAARHKELEAEGYTVKMLEAGDYSTAGKYVEFTGKLTDEVKKSLTILVKPNYTGFSFSISKPMIDKKKAESVKKSAKKGGTDTTEVAPTPAKATELSSAQQDILNQHILDALRTRILSGSEQVAFMQYMVVALAFNAGTPFLRGGVAVSHNGPVDTAERARKAYENELSDLSAITEAAEKAEKLDFGSYMELKPKEREKLYLCALASFLETRGVGDYKKLAEAVRVDGKDVVPKKAFFNRYKTDQAFDYLKRSGVTKSSGKMPIDNKKATVVSVCCSTAETAEGWRFGL